MMKKILLLCFALSTGGFGTERGGFEIFNDINDLDLRIMFNPGSQR